MVRDSAFAVNCTYFVQNVSKNTFCNNLAIRLWYSARRFNSVAPFKTLSFFIRFFKRESP